jgi:hypothetical protein
MRSWLENADEAVKALIVVVISLMLTYALAYLFAREWDCTKQRKMKQQLVSGEVDL